MLQGGGDDIFALFGMASFREILCKNHVYLKGCLRVDEILDYLYQEHVFTEAEDEECRSKTTPQDRCQCLLKKLHRKELNEYKVFCTVLARIQPSVKKTLDNTAITLGVDGLVFVSKQDLEVEFDRKLALKEEEIRTLREENVKKNYEIERLQQALEQLRNKHNSENGTLQAHLLTANKDLLRYRQKHNMLLTETKTPAIGEKMYWLKESPQGEQLLLCPKLSMEKVSVENGLKQRISKFNNTCVPFNCEVPPAPVYLEVEADVKLKSKNVFGPHLFAVGLYDGFQDRSKDAGDNEPPTWGVCVELCPTHQFEVCTQVWIDQGHLICCPGTMPSEKGTRATLKFGIVLDAGRGKLGFTDIQRGLVLGKFDIDLEEICYQLFASGARNETGASVKISLISGDDIDLDGRKQNLILQILH